MRLSYEKYGVDLDPLYNQKGSNSHYDLIQDFNSLMYSFNNHKGKKNFVSVVYMDFQEMIYYKNTFLIVSL